MNKTTQYMTTLLELQDLQELHNKHKYIITGFINSLKRMNKIKRLFCIEDEEE